MRRAVAGVVALGLLAFAVGWAVTRTDEAPSTPRAPDRAPERLTIAPTSLVDLVARVPVFVRAPGPGTLEATVTPRGEDPISLTGAELSTSDVHAVQVGIPAGAARLLRACRPARLSVVLRARSGRVVARRSRTLAPQPPRCGRYFGPSAIWNQRVENAPLDPRSEQWVADLANQVDENFAAKTPPTIATTEYSSPLYTVPANQPRVPVKLVGSRAGFGKAVAAQLAEGVPIPAGARAGGGTDHQMVVWQPATDTMWELWVAEKVKGRWTAQWGGRMDRASRSRGYFFDPGGIHGGSTATSLTMAGGTITRADLVRGEINHALGMAIPRSRANVWSYPAQRSDGQIDSVDAIPQGARFRLNPAFDVDALQAPAFVKLLARAAQRYGIYVRDTAPVVIFYAEDPASIGSDPWLKAMEPAAWEILRSFPWRELQVTRTQLWTHSRQRVAR
ncbi:hypothetical protein DVA67_018450 [Solirubrobacter sp. CPCC 204708]|uniref:Uncharacterized protein n=1 Tax=Solirubrobacter deserti TaxID=2282478 RepID=A0ABT4RM47_9ACTN|nr:hypothetical protein [Solirubrobacter deserti]MBE2317968.1 hypothetical protein [Solirubrobacter deserti]MDA0139647.1 hypothetical protein [Solirubrobacter deserti]